MLACSMTKNLSPTTRKNNRESIHMSVVKIIQIVCLIKHKSKKQEIEMRKYYRTFIC